MSGQKREKMACFGALGSYSHEALYCHFGKSGDIVFYDHFEDLVNRVEAGECRYGVLPVENSSTGGIAEVYDLILRHNCHIVGGRIRTCSAPALGSSGSTAGGCTSCLFSSSGTGTMPCLFTTSRYVATALLLQYGTECKGSSRTGR